MVKNVKSIENNIPHRTQVIPKETSGSGCVPNLLTLRTFSFPKEKLKVRNVNKFVTHSEQLVCFERPLIYFQENNLFHISYVFYETI